MSGVLKGPWPHWVALAVAAVLLCVAGARGLHVREFSLFLLLVLAGALILVLLVGSRKPRDD